jgi:predicted protein tyrosine phosphatase
MFHSVSTADIFAVIGRKELEDKLLNLPDDLILISITDPNKEFLETKNKFKKELKMKFWDWDDEPLGEYSTISEEQSRELRNFILENKGEKFIINCEAGQCRSAAIGLAIEFIFRDKYLFPEFKHFPSKILSHPRYDTNMTVFKSIISS